MTEMEIIIGFSLKFTIIKTFKKRIKGFVKTMNKCINTKIIKYKLINYKIINYLFNFLMKLR